MAMSVLPLFFLFLLGMGAADDGISEGTKGAMMPLDDIKMEIDVNAMHLSHLNNLLTQLLNVVSQHPCSENEVAEKVNEVMEEGFNATLKAFRHVKQSMKLLKLISWRMNYVKIMDVPRLQGNTPCPLPFFILNGECIYVEIKVRRSFRDARLACFVMGAELVEPTDLHGFADYIEKMNIGRDRMVYIGGTDVQKNGTWEWISGGIIEDIPWEGGRNNTDTDNDCMAVKSGFYHDISCYLRRIYTCEKALE